MSNDFAARVATHRRLTILRILEQSSGYRANESLLHTMLDDFGLGCSRDQVRTELAWLRDQGLVTLIDVAGLFIAQLTQGGQDVAGGRVTNPGVARPSAASVV